MKEQQRLRTSSNLVFLSLVTIECLSRIKGIILGHV